MVARIIIGLMQNAAILLAFTLIYELIWVSKRTFRSYWGQFTLGLFIGLATILLMMASFELVEGLIFDTRTVLITITGLFFGPVTTITALVIAALYRLFIIGGGGIVMGVGTMVAAALISLLWKKSRPNWRRENYIKELFLVAILVHLIFFILITTVNIENLESDYTLSVLLIIPALVVYPLLTVIIGVILTRRIQYHMVKDELIRHEKIHSSFFNKSSDMMFIKDNNLRYLIVNDAFCKRSGRGREQLIGQRDIDNFSKEQSDYSREVDRRVIDEGVTLEFEFETAGKFSRVVKFPVKLGGGLVGVGGVIRDITLLTKRDELYQVLLHLSRLAQIENNLPVFLEKAHFHIKKVVKAENFYIALYDKKSGKYRFPYLVDLHDRAESDQLISLEHTLTEYIRVTNKGARITAKEEREIAKEFNIDLIGERSQVWMGAPLLDATLKEVIGVVAVQDYDDANAYNEDDLHLFEIFANKVGVFIERLHILEKLEEAKRRAEYNSLKKTDFLSDISHEVRTPLNGIIGFSDFLLTTTHDKETKEYLNIINKSAHNLLYVVNDIMNLARVEAGQTTVIRENFDLVNLLKEILIFFKGPTLVVDLILDSSGYENLYIKSDRLKIQQIFVNLVNSSIKFTHKGYVKFGFTLENDLLTLFVEDSGAGIKEAMHRQILEIFREIDEKGQGHFEKSEVGLSVVKEYSKLLGGELILETEVGKGTKFEIKLKKENYEI